jgi:methylphosphotriester-DNA--protein-cysteine methyltransferase
VDFSDRSGPLFITLGPGVTRRDVVQRAASATPIERFLGHRLHGFSTIVRIELGDGSVRGSFGRIEVGPGDVLLLPPGGVDYSFSGPRRIEILAVAESHAAGVVVRERDLPASLFERDTSSIVAALRAAPARCCMPQSTVDGAAMRALARMDERNGAARLAPVAHELGYTADGLAKLLRRTTGLGFARWRDALVMAHVRAELVKGAPVVRVARHLRLDASYVHRRFAAAHDATPRRWRAAPVLPASARAHQWDTLVRIFEGIQPATG